MQTPHNLNYLPSRRLEFTIGMLKQWDTLTQLDREQMLAALRHDSKEAAQVYVNGEVLKVARVDIARRS